jgi:hypothetical protein
MVHGFNNITYHGSTNTNSIMAFMHSSIIMQQLNNSIRNASYGHEVSNSNKATA